MPFKLNFGNIPSTNFGTSRESPLPLAAYQRAAIQTGLLQLPTATSIGLLPTCVHSGIFAKFRSQPIQIGLLNFCTNIIERHESIFH